jgi:pyruvate dehydrogenase E2 component (dihydrolipoamide acetyltransferase)
MPIPFIMPKFDMDQESATILEWFKQEGDPVRLDEPVLVVETDKVSIEVPSPAAGRLARLSAKPGDVVPVTSVIAYILAEGEDLDDLAVTGASQAARPASGSPESPAMKAPTFKADGAKAIKEAIPATPVAARMAQSMGINLADVLVSEGRVTKADVERFLQQAPAPAGRVRIPATPAARRLAGELNIDLEGVPASGPLGRVQASDVTRFAGTTRVPAAREERPAEKVPLAGIRSTIATRMQASFHEAPHIALTVEVDVTQLEATRARMNELATLQKMEKISLTALLVRIAGWALVQNPAINSSLIDDTIYLWKDVNIGVATAIQDGLIVPVIHHANSLPASEINRRLKELAERARNGTLSLEEVKDGTFTISNLGMFAVQQFRAIINPPESAILAVGKVVRKPVVINAQDEIAVRPMMAMTLSADHRVIDGVMAARFLSDLVRAIESPDLLLF